MSNDFFFSTGLCSAWVIKVRCALASIVWGCLHAQLAGGRGVYVYVNILLTQGATGSCQFRFSVWISKPAKSHCRYDSQTGLLDLGGLPHRYACFATKTGNHLRLVSQAKSEFHGHDHYFETMLQQLSCDNQSINLLALQISRFSGQLRGVSSKHCSERNGIGFICQRKWGHDY